MWFRNEEEAFAYAAFKQLVEERKEQGIVLCIVGEEEPLEDDPWWETTSEADINRAESVREGRVCFWVHADTTEDAVIKKFEHECVPNHIYPIHAWIDADWCEAWGGYCDTSMEGVKEYRNFPVWL